MNGTRSQNVGTLLIVLTLFAAGPAASQDIADTIRKIERERLQALVDADMVVVEQLHADDFELINPHGRVWPRKQYLGAVASGAIRYQLWSPGEIQVRVYGDAAVIHYQADLKLIFHQQEVPRWKYWYTNLYELRDGKWLAVWSQATEVFEQKLQ